MSCAFRMSAFLQTSAHKHRCFIRFGHPQRSRLEFLYIWVAVSESVKVIIVDIEPTLK